MTLMKRRTALLGLGLTAAGVSTVFGTGAFSVVTANRTVTVSVADDSNAFLGLVEGSETSTFGASSDHLDWAATSKIGYNSGVLEIAMDDTVASGSGVNAAAFGTLGKLSTLDGTPGDETLNVVAFAIVNQQDSSISVSASATGSGLPSRTQLLVAPDLATTVTDILASSVTITSGNSWGAVLWMDTQDTSDSLSSIELTAEV